VQAASDVYSPISGEVLEVNSVLVDEPAKVGGVESNIKKINLILDSTA
jgi:glycine cleavage system H lipoate-binding protein